jgi:hypothetical protein
MLNVHHTKSGKYIQKVKELYFIPQQENLQDNWSLEKTGYKCPTYYKWEYPRK